MKKISIVKREFSSFAKYKDNFYCDISCIRLLHVNDIDLSTKFNSLWYNDYNRGVTTNLDRNFQINDNMRWSPIEVERMNTRLRQELEDSSLIICEDELTKDFLSALFEYSEKNYNIIVNKDEQFSVGTLFIN